MGIHDGHRRRMKDRYLRTGLEGFDDLAILELLLFYAIPRQDTNRIAHALLDRFGSLATVLEAPEAELQKVPGVGESAAILLTLIPRVARQHMIERSSVGTLLVSSTACGEYLSPRFFGERDEVVWLLCMDAKMMVLDCRLLYRGSVNSAGVSVRKIVETALACNATFVVLAHNHTSGIALPSIEDERTTEQLWRGLDAVGITLMDHIIVAGDDFVSLLQSGFFQRFAPKHDDLTEK